MIEALGGSSSVPSWLLSVALPAEVAWKGTTKLAMMKISKFAGTSGCASWPSSQPPAAAASGCQGARAARGSSAPRPSSASRTTKPASDHSAAMGMAIQPPVWVRPKSAQTTTSDFHRRSTSSAITRTVKPMSQTCGRSISSRCRKRVPSPGRASTNHHGRGTRIDHSDQANAPTMKSWPSSTPSREASCSGSVAKGISSTWNSGALSTKRS